VYIYPFLVTR